MLATPQRLLVPVQLKAADFRDTSASIRSKPLAMVEQSRARGAVLR